MRIALIALLAAGAAIFAMQAWAAGSCSPRRAAGEGAASARCLSQERDDNGVRDGKQNKAIPEVDKDTVKAGKSKKRRPQDDDDKSNKPITGGRSGAGENALFNKHNKHVDHHEDENAAFNKRGKHVNHHEEENAAFNKPKTPVDIHEDNAGIKPKLVSGEADDGTKSDAKIDDGKQPSH
ncbi:MAG: hypothetical protein ABI612_11235, partial [Betaproteobacteria bacterium]